ncbi:MAG: cysteine hydrolase family protein [Synergistales bacterium]
MGKTLLVIDLQNDYFPGGKYPLWNAEGTLFAIEKVIGQAKLSRVPVVLVQHIADETRGISPFFNKGTEGAGLHPRVLAAVPEAPVIVKRFADGFVGTPLEETLDRLGTTDLLVCGMMTQNCVTHTAISKSAEKYRVVVLQDCCAAVDEMIHNIALNALSTRVVLAPWREVLP